MSYFRKPRRGCESQFTRFQNPPPRGLRKAVVRNPPGVNQSPLSLIMQVDCVMFKWISWDFYGDENQHPVKSKFSVTFHIKSKYPETFPIK